MNVRTTVPILALISVITAASGGYLYYESAQKSIFKETERELVERSNDLKNGIISLISANQNTVVVMAQVERLQKVLMNQDQTTLSRADRILDNLFKAVSRKTKINKFQISAERR